ncbi:MAG TPA: TetR/AcrR family transcriptional regulator [Anaerolineae bacterium]|nr:TetR/AcrR family transcriptional regulator [Anaerolineae bacterium]
MTDSTQSTTRQRILDIAGDLFFHQGYRAIGVDTIVKETGVAKMTLYRHFRSKDDLIVAYLEQVNRLMTDWFDEAAKPYEGKPRDQLVAVFAALEKLVKSPKCFGCAFLVAASEFPELDSPGHRVALAHKRAVRDRLRDLAGQAGARQPDELADQLLLLMDGAFAAVRMFGPTNPGMHVVEAATVLIDAQVRPARATRKR